MSENETDMIKKLIEVKEEERVLLSKLEACKATIRETEDCYLSEIGKKIVNEKLLQEMYWTSRVTYDDRVVLVGDFGEGKELKELIELAEPITDWMYGHVPLVKASDIGVGLVVVKDSPIQISIQTPLDFYEEIDMMVVLDLFKKVHIDFDRIDLGGLDKEIEIVEGRVSILENWRKMLSN
jgi:hypothetical protein